MLPSKSIQEYDAIEEEYVQKTYSNISNQFHKTRNNIWISTKEQILFIANNLAHFEKDTLRILEVGCGNGRNLIAFRNMLDHKTELIGIEPCQKLCEIIKEKNEIDCIINDGHFSQEISKFNGTVDIVLSIAVIPHLATEERRMNALRELFRLASPEAYILIQVIASHKDRAMVNWKALDSGNNDFLVPWVRTGDFRYYHLFEKGELEEMVGKVIADGSEWNRNGSNNFQIVHSFEDRHNYGVLLQRFKQL